VAPRATEAFARWAEEGRIELLERLFQPADLDGAFVAFTATDARPVNEAVVAEARRRGILVNAADAPELCDFFVPSFGRRGPVVVAVSSGGRAPGLSRVLRRRALDVVGPEYGALARLLGRLRRIVPPGPARTRALESIMELGAAELLARGERRILFQRIRALLSMPRGVQ
jgi:precorrin-2 dehydrogenase/sirohydrochlorin ferrochelatase